MKNKSKLSIVLIAYNSAETINDTLDSICSQNYRDLEIICVDDVSSDDTVRIMHEWAEKNPGIRIIEHTENRGCLASRYDGLKEADGKYVMFIDADDTYRPDVFAELIDTMEKTDADLCEFQPNVIYRDDRTPEEIRAFFTNYYIFSDRVDTENFTLPELCFQKKEIKVNVWNKIFKTQVVKKAFEGFRGEHVTSAEDWFFSFMVLNTASKYVRINKKCINYFVGQGISTIKTAETPDQVLMKAKVAPLFGIMKKWAEANGRNDPETKEILEIIHDELSMILREDFIFRIPLRHCNLYFREICKYEDECRLLVGLSSRLFVVGESEQLISKLKSLELHYEDSRLLVKLLAEELHEIKSCTVKRAEIEKLRAENLAAMRKLEDHFYDSTTWKVGSIVTYLPRHLKELLKKKKENAGEQTGVDAGEQTAVAGKMPAPASKEEMFTPHLKDYSWHNFAGLIHCLKRYLDFEVEKADVLRNYEYRREYKLLLVTDGITRKETADILNSCKEKGILPAVWNITGSGLLKGLRDVPVLSGTGDPGTVKNIYENYADLFDGVILDLKDAQTAECFRTGRRNRLLISDRAIAVSKEERYLLRNDTKTDSRISDRFDWLLFGRYEIQDARISVIIPTINAGSEFAALLSTINDQAKIADPEIVIVDSGSTDGTLETARAFGGKIVEIPKEAFSHSFARNTGAEAASGEYLLFMTQDAMPSSRMSFCRLVNMLGDHQAAAVSPAEECRADADLFAKTCVYFYKKDHFEDWPSEVRVLPEDGKYASMRASSALDDVMCMTYRDVFLKYRYRGNYAEDCDYALRLLRDGCSVAITQDTKVIHSHNRGAAYTLKRSIIELLRCFELYPGMPLAGGDAKELVGKALFVYLYMLLLRRIVAGWKKGEMSYQQMDPMFTAASKEALRSLSEMDSAAKRELITIPGIEDGKFACFMEKLSNIGDVTTVETPDTASIVYLIRNGLWMINAEKGFFTELDPKEICSCMEKHAANMTGNLLGTYLIKYRGRLPEVEELIDLVEARV